MVLHTYEYSRYYSLMYSRYYKLPTHIHICTATSINLGRTGSTQSNGHPSHKTGPHHSPDGRSGSVVVVAPRSTGRRWGCRSHDGSIVDKRAGWSTRTGCGSGDIRARGVYYWAVIVPIKYRKNIFTLVTIASLSPTWSIGAIPRKRGIAFVA